MVSTVVSCPISSIEIQDRSVSGNTLTSVLERKVNSVASATERNATHLGTGAREDSGHLPIELLGGPEAAGLVEKGVDLRDRAAIACGDWSGPGPKLGFGSKKIHPRGPNAWTTYMQICTHRTACAADRSVHVFNIHTYTHKTTRGKTPDGREENALEIGDLDGWMRVDFLIACCLALGVAVEELEEDFIAQEFGATRSHDRIVHIIYHTSDISPIVCVPAGFNKRTSGRRPPAHPPPARPGRPFRQGGRCACAVNSYVSW